MTWNARDAMRHWKDVIRPPGSPAALPGERAATDPGPPAGDPLPLEQTSVFSWGTESGEEDEDLVWPAEYAQELRMHGWRSAREWARDARIIRRGVEEV